MDVDPTHVDSRHADPTHSRSDPHSYWTTTNMAEAVPGVMTPLGWTVWGPATELGARSGLRAIGAFRAEQARIPDRPEDRAISAFYGRAVVRVDFFCQVGDVMPGTTGAAVAKQVFGFVPPGYQPNPSRQRYPIIAARFPATFVSVPRRVTRTRARTQLWWEDTVGRAPHLDTDAARALFAEARALFEANMQLHGLAVLAGVQPVYEQLAALAQAAGTDPMAMLTGCGAHEETEIVADLWACSRGRCDVETVARRHGFHGPAEGDIASLVWREDDGPLRRMLEGYRALPDSMDPVALQERRHDERRVAEAELLAALPAVKRARARLAFRLAHRYIPLRGTGKVSFLQAFDGARAAARRIAECLTLDGTIDDPGDLGYLTADELCGRLPPRPREVIAARREHTERYRTLDLPTFWQGMPESTDLSAIRTAEQEVRLEGVGSSPGVVEGPVRVVVDPAEVDLEPGEILVAHTTDPSWASLMYLSAGLVVDIGGSLSHAAIVARELGVPCVMNTKSGTQRLHTGDICRVDGTAGVVHLISAAVAQ